MLRRRSSEAAEQGRPTGGGGGGAKGGGQGEREPMPHVPDTGPGKRVTGAGARTEGREASRQTSEVGAVCGKAARTVLCGGRPVMGVPTAIASSDYAGVGVLRSTWAVLTLRRRDPDWNATMRRRDSERRASTAAE